MGRQLPPCGGEVNCSSWDPRGWASVLDGPLETSWSGTHFSSPILAMATSEVETLGIYLPLLGGGTRESLGPPNSDDEGSLHRAGQDSGKGPDSPG